MHPTRRRTLLLRATCASIAAVLCALAQAAEPSAGSGAKPGAKPPTRHRPATHPTPAADARQHGSASFYAKHFDGKKTASGERYDPQAMTAAHRTLPLGTQVRVVNPKNDKSVVVTVNDRGPVSKHRMIDVSSAAADQLGMRGAGVTKVETQVVGKDAPNR